MAIQPAANTAWFNFILTERGFDGLEVYAFTGTEELNTPFEFDIELVSRDANVDLPGALGKEAVLEIFDWSGGKRIVHGVIREMEQLHTANAFTHYRCFLVPRLWFLSRTQDHKIFQNMDVTAIINIMLQKHAFVADKYSMKLSRTYPVREYCVQYAESDLHFIDRLCEEEGIIYYFEHSDAGHVLCFTDAAGGPFIPGENAIRFFPGSGALPDTSVIHRLSYKHRINSDITELRDWNFTTPKLDIAGTVRETQWEKAPVPKGMSLETYQFPHLFQTTPEARRYVEIEILRQLTFREWIECLSNVSRYLPGFQFDLHSHQRQDVNRAWFLVSVKHEGKQAGVLQHEAPDDRGHEYISRVTAIPDTTRFIPELRHPKKRIIGNQSAIVTGPAGEEIYPDSYGRVKVQFHWDRFGQGNEHTSCWVRVSQGWAGGQYGIQAIPRIGHEVMVSFMEGDPDRPVITGRVHHSENMPPYALPENKTRTAIKTKTERGDGFNEIRFEDKQGLEQIFVHAQMDMDIIALKDRKEWIKGERHLTVDKDRIEHVKGLISSQTDDDRMEATAKKRTITVGEDEAHQVGGNFHQKVEKNVFIQGNTSGVFEFAQDVTIKAPGGFIKIDAQGITILGKVVNINSGGCPVEGFPVQAVPARAAMLADARDGSAGKAGTVKGAQQAPQTIAKNIAAGSDQNGLAIGGQTFSRMPADVSALAGAGGIAALAAGAFGALRNAAGDAAQLSLAQGPQALEWRKTVLSGLQEQTVAGKIDLVNDYFAKNISLPDTPISEVQGLKDVVTSGTGTELDISIAKYQTLRECGVPAESMEVVFNEHTAFVSVRDQSQVLIAEANPVPGSPCRTAQHFVRPSSPEFAVNHTGVSQLSAVGQ